VDGAADGRVWDFSNRGKGQGRSVSMLGKAGTGHKPMYWSANFEVKDFENDMRGPLASPNWHLEAEQHHHEKIRGWGGCGKQRIEGRRDEEWEEKDNGLGRDQFR
jgi:hypothetical protein